MLFITGPLYSGKRTFAAQFGGRQIYEVQDRAAEMTELQALADELDGRIRVAGVNVDDAPDVAARFGVNTIPTLLLFKDGRLLGRPFVGPRSQADIREYLSANGVL